MKTTSILNHLILLAGMILLGQSSMAQYTPTATLPVTLNENNAVAVTDYQVLITINTQAMVFAGTLEPDGRDIRFGGDACLSDTLPHWVESGMNTATTRIWVMIPALGASASLDIYMFGGDPLATDASDFNAVFPNAIITNGSNATIGGTLDIGWLQVDITDTLFITGGTVAQLFARVAVIEGVIMANGAGYAGGIVGPNTGSGPGGGGGSTNSGSGGGSYGNFGGTGGFDNGDTPGVGGSVNGTDTGLDIDAGSGGGASSNTFGGNGGGGLSIRSEQIKMYGEILVNGDNGQMPGGSRGGGGGSGGGVLLFGHNFNFTGLISANGGNGSVGTSTANDDGGGGSGGRIKLFYSSGTPTGITSVLGGIGGPNGSAAGGMNGEIGTVSSLVQAFNPITYILGTPGTPLSLSVAISEPTASICLNDSLTFTATGVAPFDFQVNGSSVQNGAMNIYSSTTLSDGDVVTVITPGCAIDFDVTVFALPVPTITPSIATSVCFGDTIVLSTDPTFASHSWSTTETTSSIEIYGSGTYDVTVVDINGCIGSESYAVTYLGTSPVISGTLIACDGDVVSLSIDDTQMASFVWSTTETVNPIDVTSSAIISIQTIDNDGCSGTDTVDVVFNPLPTPVITETGGVLDAGAGYSTYQWQLNGTDVAGATAQTLMIINGGDYTVIVTDANGCSGTSVIFNSTVSLTSLDEMTISIHPNPFNDQILVNINTSGQDQINLMVTNQQGQQVYAELVQLNSGNSEFNLDLAHLSKGLYFVNVVGASTRQIYKIIKQ